MPAPEDQVAEWKHAYQILDVPPSASADSIKLAYRRLVKRWHPDHYASGTQEYAEATQMTKLINGAYSAIENAPLCSHIDTFPADYAKSGEAYWPSASNSSDIPGKSPPKTDWLEFWIRFAFGAMVGALVSFRYFLRFYYLQPSKLILPALVLILGFGFAAARGGDNFWRSPFRRWWFWRWWW
jgi:curved DNA-binding protein CbpA